MSETLYSIDDKTGVITEIDVDAVYIDKDKNVYKLIYNKSPTIYKDAAEKISYRIKSNNLKNNIIDKIINNLHIGKIDNKLSNILISLLMLHFGKKQEIMAKNKKYNFITWYEYNHIFATDVITGEVESIYWENVNIHYNAKVINDILLYRPDKEFYNL